MNFEISFLSVDYLKNINTKTSDFEKISKFKPVITGTIPFNIDHNFSDVDISAIFSNRVVEKLILHPFLFHKNGRLKQFC